MHYLSKHNLSKHIYHNISNLSKYKSIFKCPETINFIEDLKLKLARIVENRATEKLCKLCRFKHFILKKCQIYLLFYTNSMPKDFATFLSFLKSINIFLLT